jgi:Protein of unknown function (DUF3300)
MKPLYHGIAVFLCGSWVFASIQNGTASPTTTSLSQVASQAGQQEPEQLRQLVTAIALYPDALLGQMMAAATYPREVIEAEQWMLQHRGLTGDAVAKEVDKQSWDFEQLGKACAKEVGSRSVMDSNPVMHNGRMWGRFTRIQRRMCSAARGRRPMAT